MKTVTPFNIWNYSPVSANNPSYTLGEVLFTFAATSLIVVGILSGVAKNWTVLAVVVFILPVLTIRTVTSSRRAHAQERGKREAFLTAWKEHFGHQGPTGALDSLYRTMRGVPNHNTSTAVYQVENVDYILSMANDGTLILEITS